MCSVARADAERGWIEGQQFVGQWLHRLFVPRVGYLQRGFQSGHSPLFAQPNQHRGGFVEILAPDPNAQVYFFEFARFAKEEALPRQSIAFGFIIFCFPY